jgi:Uma2 family endonuclease
MTATAPAQSAVADANAATGGLIARRRWTAGEYHRMAEVGILHEDDPVELIAGEIVEMAAIGFRHAWSVGRLNKHAVRLVGDEVEVWVQNPIHLAADTEPEPDLVLFPIDPTRTSLPTPAEVLLVIEVADSSVAYDRAVKLPLYAAAGIREAWLVDLTAGTVERFNDPRDGRYRRVEVGTRGDTLASTVLPKLAIPVALALGEQAA